MLNNTLKFFGLAISALAVTVSSTAMAGQAQSWNLSRDMMKGIRKNPTGIWWFMENRSGIHDPAKYIKLPNYKNPCYDTIDPINKPVCWQDSQVSFPPLVEINGAGSYRGVPLVHPGQDTPVIVRWKSPVTGIVNIAGTISSIDPTCGDGVGWSIENGADIIRSGILPNGEGAAFFATDISITAGASLYFIVNMNGSTYCDSSAWDLIITSQQ